MSEEFITDVGRSGYRILIGDVSWDPGSISDGDEAVTDIPVEGASIGDFVLVSASVDILDLTLTGAVTGNNTVTVQLSNSTGGAIDLGFGRYNALVIANPWLRLIDQPGASPP